MLYTTLDGFQQQMEALTSVKDDGQLADWFAGYNGWTEKNWGPVYANMCDGTSFFTVALRATAMWAVLSRITGIKGEIPADAMMELLSLLADYDSSAMYEDISPHIRLQLNRIVRDEPLCSEMRTQAFYKTIDSFEEQSRMLMDVDSNESLVDWVFSLSPMARRQAGVRSMPIRAVLFSSISITWNRGSIWQPVCNTTNMQVVRLRC